MPTVFEVPNDEIKSAIAFLQAALAVNEIYDCTASMESLQKLRLTNVDAAILQLGHAKKALEKEGVRTPFIR